MYDLEFLDNYYRKNRQVGHTTAMLNGAKSDKNILVVFSNNMQKNYIDLPKEQFVNVRNLQQSLMGRKNPVVVDHYTMQVMHEETKKALNKKDETIEKLERKIKKLEKRMLDMGLYI